MPDQRDFNPQLMCDYIRDVNENHSKLDKWNCVSDFKETTKKKH